MNNFPSLILILLNTIISILGSIYWNAWVGALAFINFVALVILIIVMARDKMNNIVEERIKDSTRFKR